MVAEEVTKCNDKNAAQIKMITVEPLGLGHVFRK